MSIENELRSYILSKYRSIREFSMSCDIPYTTLMSMLKRGIENSNVVGIVKLCNCLGIDANMIVKGSIVEVEVEKFTREIMNTFEKLNTEGKLKVKYYMEDLLSTDKYKK